MGTEVDRDPRRRLWQSAAPLAMVPLFLGGLYFAAKSGIAIADKQVPVGSLVAPGTIPSGSYWEITKAGMAVSNKAAPLRDFDFARAGSGAGKLVGGELLGEESIGWRLRIMPGGDRRYLKMKVLSGERQGDEMWVIAEQIGSHAAAAPK